MDKQARTWKSYWSLTERERAALTDEEIRKLIPVELMELGVEKPVEPQYKPVVELDFLKKETYFFVEDTPELSFGSAELVSKVLDMNPVRIARDYSYNNSDRPYIATKISPNKRAISSVQAITPEDAAKYEAQIGENKRTKERNAELRQEYEEKVKAMEKATAKIWDDWYDCMRKGQRYKSILETYREYLELTSNFMEQAQIFLAKLYPQAEIDIMRTWFEKEIAELEGATNEPDNSKE